MGPTVTQASEYVHLLAPLSDCDSARLLLRRSPRTITMEELQTSSPSAVSSDATSLDVLSVHPVVRSLDGNPGKIIRFVAKLHTHSLNDAWRRIAKNVAS